MAENPYDAPVLAEVIDKSVIDKRRDKPNYWKRLSFRVNVFLVGVTLFFACAFVFFVAHHWVVPEVINQEGRGVTTVALFFMTLGATLVTALKMVLWH